MLIRITLGLRRLRSQCTGGGRGGSGSRTHWKESRWLTKSTSLTVVRGSGLSCLWVVVNPPIFDG